MSGPYPFALGAPAAAGPATWPRDGALVVAVAADARSDAAVRVAAELATRYGVRPQVVHTAPSAWVRASLVAVVGHPVAWPVHHRSGPPADVIVREAADFGAALVVMGLRHHGPLDVLTGDETTLRVMRNAPCPVLGVASALVGLPQRAVVGVDFSPASVVAAHAALALLARGGTLVLAHVEVDAPPAERGPDPADPVQTLGVEGALDRLATDLGAPADVVVEHAHVVASPVVRIADALAALADRSGALLLAVGSHRRDWLDRALLGSVATDLARDARHSLLVVPPLGPTASRRLDT